MLQADKGKMGEMHTTDCHKGEHREDVLQVDMGGMWTCNGRTEWGEGYADIGKHGMGREEGAWT